MLKSLFSGVSGLQSHQVAMDVESNNIANVNTTGFKYSRANFSDLLAQTKAIATAPQGALGGKNAVQVGLGSTVSSMTRIFSQGSVQNSDKNTDMAIQGDGFFIVSPDGGNTYKYTRSGDFKFDAGGNFVDNNGFIAQGWLRDEDTGLVDATAPISDINIPPGLTTPANPSSEVVIKANLNSGPLVESYSPSYSVASGTPPSLQSPAIYTGDAIDNSGNPIASGDMGVMYNEIGEAFALQEDQGIWASFQSSTVTASNVTNASSFSKTKVTSNLAAGNDALNITVRGVPIVLADSGAIQTADANGVRYETAINDQLSAAGVSGVTASYDSTNDFLTITDTNIDAQAITVTDAGQSGVAATTIGGNQLSLSFELDDGTVKTIATTGGTGIETANANGARYVSAINAQTATTGVSATFDNVSQKLILTNTNANTDASHNIRLTVSADDNTGLDSVNDDQTAYRYQYSPTGTSNLAGVDKTFKTMSDLRYAMEVEARTYVSAGTTVTTVTASLAGADNTFAATFTAGTPVVTTNFTVGGVTAANQTAEENAIEYMNAINAAGITGITASVNGASLTISNSSDEPYNINVTTAGNSGLAGATNPLTAASTALNNTEISVNEEGKFEMINNAGSPGDRDINLKITGIANSDINENEKFTRNMEAMNSVLPIGSTGKAFSQSFNAATHSSSIDIFDSLGSKHTLRTEFRKTAVDLTTGSTWDMNITVPVPATIDTVAPTNEKRGSIRFNNDGSLATYNPPNVSFSGNNGSSPNQQVALSFGTANSFDGMTSFDSASSTSGISQDGYTGGDLIGIRIDQSGTLVGSFSNGRSFGLAQIGMAKFTNNEGLGTEGGNIFVQSANSGDPIIGTAATAGRGFIQSSALEASNVDLSRALTQLIIVQRGFQANGKTITTSDQLLQTLIGLKN